MRTVQRRKAHARVTMKRRNSKGLLKSNEGTTNNSGGCSNDIPKKKKVRGRPWKPGQSGNPKGRPRKELCITSLIKDFLEETDEQSGKTWAQLVAEAVTKGSAQLNKTAMKELLSRVDGPVKQKLEIQMPEPFLVEVEEVGPDEPLRTTVSRRRRGEKG